MASPGTPSTRVWGAEFVLDALLAGAVAGAIALEAAVALQAPRGDDDEDERGRPPMPDGFGDDVVHEALEHWGGGTWVLLAVIAALAAGGVLLRRRRPWLAVAMAGTGALIAAVFLGLPVAVTVAFAMTVYSLTVERGWAAAAAASGAGMAGVLVTLLVRRPEEAGGLVLLYVLAAIAVPLLSAAATRSRRAYLGEVEERLRRVQREQQASTDKALADERVRLARDLHDVLAHSLTVVNMQVGVASHLLSSHPDRAASALAEARQAGTAAVAELRSTLSLLRGDAAADRTPVARLSATDDLIDRVRATGLPLTYRREVSDDDVNAAVGLVVYRVVQEGLTNVVKHAGTAAATRVDIVPAPGSAGGGSPGRDLLVEVRNDPGGLPASAPGSGDGGGIGLEGLAERVLALGGRWYSGPTDSGGFLLRAEIPAAILPTDFPTLPAAPDSEGQPT